MSYLVTTPSIAGNSASTIAAMKSDSKTSANEPKAQNAINGVLNPGSRLEAPCLLHPQSFLHMSGRFYPFPMKDIPLPGSLPLARALLTNSVHDAPSTTSVMSDIMAYVDADTNSTVGKQQLLQICEVDECRLAADAPKLMGPGPMHSLLVGK